MSVTFSIPVPYRKVAGGQAEVQVEGKTVREALAALNQLYPELGKRLINANGALNPYVSAYVNGERLVGPDSLTRTLNEGDRLIVIPVIGGG